jgi:guanine deaminase
VEDRIATGPPTAFALRGAAAFLRADPFVVSPAEALGHEADARLVVRDGRIDAFGPASRTPLPTGVAETALGSAIMLPGLIDCHVHYPQLGVVGAMGHALLPWLENHTFPAERALADPEQARALARCFVAELARNGTTTAAVFCSVHPHSVDALFEAAAGSGLQLIAGKCLMDRNAPDGLTDDARGGCEDMAALIARWHGRERFGCAVTVRFLGTSSPEQLEAAAALWRAHPGTWLQSHLSEDPEELALIARLFPGSRDYVDAFDRYGLLGPRGVLGHGIHLSPRERARLAESGTALAHCPTSNLFLGSGLFDAMATRRAGIEVGLASDVGAGTSLSMLATMGAAYQVARLRGALLAPAHLLWLATAGAARALGLGARSGNLAPGLDADVTVADPAATPLLALRAARAAGPEDLLGALMTCGDDRAVRLVLAGGRVVKGTLPAPR